MDIWILSWLKSLFSTYSDSKRVVYKSLEAANPANFHPNWAGLAVLFSRQLLKGSQDFFCFNILISIYFFKYETSETHARAFLPLNISAIGTVEEFSVKNSEFQIIFIKSIKYNSSTLGGKKWRRSYQGGGGGSYPVEELKVKISEIAS